MTASIAALLALTLVGVLFAVAALIERSGVASRLNPRLRHVAYTLALGVYCSSWTFYGAVGTAVSEGWNYLPIYLAPAIMLMFAPGFLRKLAEAVAAERASTISDFIAARFGHDPGVARIITIIALCGTIPYVALQLRSMGIAIATLSGQDVVLPVMVAAAMVLSLFAILFGARRYEIAGRSEGLVFSIALESVIKLAALGLVGGYAVHVLAGASNADWLRASSLVSARFSPGNVTLDTAVIAAVSALAIIVLPRQFYMGLAEAHAPSDLPRARFGVALYLLVMAALVVPIALAGLVALPDGISPDSYVLLLPAPERMNVVSVAA
ncbi:MAG: hybrid sensor histidine kinase/response regulator, partial [Novosphingobium sp.]|nr:hybrid sensor histidine kinase/response regulator [Novosphingobium sp.]